MKLKLLTGLSIVIFTVFMTGIFTAGILSYAGKKEKDISSKNNGLNNNLLENSDNANSDSILSAENVAKHSSASDCWIIIENNVYDVTSFASKHPGGAELVTKYCGKDATNAFDTRDRNPGENHSGFARNLLRSYYLGPLGRTPQQIIYPDTNNQNPAVQDSSNNTQQPTASQSQTSLTINISEVANHNTLQNCWIIVSGKVYNVTSFLSLHPGGQSTISPYCGKDATTAFQNRGGTGSHSSYAYNLLNNYYIAALGSVVTISGNSGSGSTILLPKSLPTGSGSLNNANITPTAGFGQNQNLTLSTGEVANHNTLQNCWLIIGNKVYDVTTFISQHPGGRTSITNYCGKESTTAFQTRGGSGSHSSYAYSLLNNYLIGSIGSSIPLNPTNTPVPSQGGGGSQSITNTPIPTSSSGSSCPSSIPQIICTTYSGSTIIKKSGSFEDDGNWEGEVYINGSCRHIKVSSSGSISSNQNC